MTVAGTATPEDPAELRPNQRYYQRNVGGWRGRFSFAITDGPALRAALGALDRLRLLTTVHLPKVVGPFRIETRVQLLPNREQPHTMVHQLRLSKWGVTLYRTDEVFTLEPDGLGVTIRGTEWVFPLLWWRRDWPVCRGAVAPTAQTAHYEIPWFGSTLAIRTRNTPEGIDVAMSTPWGAGVQRLTREPS